MAVRRYVGPSFSLGILLDRSFNDTPADCEISADALGAPGGAPHRALCRPADGLGAAWRRNVRAVCGDRVHVAPRRSASRAIPAGVPVVRDYRRLLVLRVHGHLPDGICARRSRTDGPAQPRRSGGARRRHPHRARQRFSERERGGSAAPGPEAEPAVLVRHRHLRHRLHSCLQHEVVRRPRHPSHHPARVPPRPADGVVVRDDPPGCQPSISLVVARVGIHPVTGIVLLGLQDTADSAVARIAAILAAMGARSRGSGRSPRGRGRLAWWWRRCS